MSIKKRAPKTDLMTILDGLIDTLGWRQCAHIKTMSYYADEWTFHTVIDL
jgi:hypothetical protein